MSASGYDSDCETEAGSYCRYDFDGTSFQMPDTPAERKLLMKTFVEKLAQLEDEHRDHERSVESRIWMSRKEEKARLAMMDWLEEEIENMEAKIEKLRVAIDNDSGIED